MLDTEVGNKWLLRGLMTLALNLHHSNSSQLEHFNHSLGKIFNTAMPLSENFLSLPLSLSRSH